MRQHTGHLHIYIRLREVDEREGKGEQRNSVHTTTDVGPSQCIIASFLEFVKDIIAQGTLSSPVDVFTIQTWERAKG